MNDFLIIWTWLIIAVIGGGIIFMLAKIYDKMR
jgi:hypothetical protein